MDDSHWSWQGSRLRGPACQDPQGASIEARLYAENPVKDFVPSPGQLTDVQFPSDARVDTWVSRGTKISAEYDPTLAKIIVHGSDRADALRKLQRALDETVVAGVTTNLDYLKSIVGSQMFAEAKVSTRVLDSYNYTPNAIEITSPAPTPLFRITPVEPSCGILVFLLLDPWMPTPSGWPTRLWATTPRLLLSKLHLWAPQLCSTATL